MSLSRVVLKTVTIRWQIARGVFILAAGFTCLDCGHAQEANDLKKLSDEQVKQKLAERDELWNRAQAFDEQGKSSAAINAAEQALAIEWELFGNIHQEVALTIEWIAIRYEAQEKFRVARRARQAVLQINTQLFGKDHWKVTDARMALQKVQRLAKLNAEQRKQLREAKEYNAKAGALYRQGKYGQAAHIAEQALQRRRMILGEQDPDTATSLNELALFYMLMGDYAKAVPLYKKALEIDRKVLGEEHPTTATILNNLAGLYDAMGDYAKADPLYKKALEIDRKVLGEEHPTTATILDNLAGLYKSMGDYAKAEPLIKQALEIRKKVLGEEHADTAIGLSNLAVLYMSTGDYAKAEPPLRQALEIRKKALDEEHPDTAIGLDNLAEFYFRMGDYAKAEPLLRQALEISKKALSEEHPRTAERLNNLAELYREVGDYAKAEPLYKKALEIDRKVLGEHADTAISLNNLAELYREMGDYMKAEPLFKQAMEIHKQVLGEQHASTAIDIANLALLYSSAGDYAKAEPLYKQALEIYRKTLGEQHPHIAVSLNNLAELYRKMGDYSEAEPLYRQALAITRKHVELTAVAQSQRQQLVMAEGLRYQLDHYLSSAMASNQHQEQAFREVLAWKGATLVRQRQMRNVGENAEVAPLFKELQQAATRLATLSRMVPKLEQHVAWRRQITELTAKKERLESELSRKSAEFRQAKKQVTLEDVLTALPQDAVLVDFLEYWRFNPKPKDDQESSSQRSLLAFVVRGGEPIVLLDLGPVAPLSEAIDTWRQTFGSARDGVAAGRLLRQRIWAPVEKHLDGSKLVLVSADGALGRLPIAALPGKEEGTYLLEDYRLAMLPVPQLLPALVSELGRKELAGELLLIGDVNYDDEPKDAPAKKRRRRTRSTELVRGQLKFKPLEGAAREVAFIEELYTDIYETEPGEIKKLKQNYATEQAVRDLAPKFNTLHIATHGFFADPSKKSALDSTGEDRDRFLRANERDQYIRGFNPGLLSGVALAGANRKPEADKDDGILTAEEISTLSLDGVDLVVLSACETGLGEVAGGEGLLGVQRAFQVAGARSTVASCWDVPDIATERLMGRFYRNYWQERMSKLDALREAQLWLLNHPEEIRGVTRAKPDTDAQSKRLSPQFWAAFSLSGDWR